MKHVGLSLLAVVIMTGCSTTAPTSRSRGATPSNPAEALALVAQAQMRIERGEIAEGLKLLRRATTLDPGNPELLEEFGLALADAGIGDEAVAQLSAASSLSDAGHATLGMLLAQAAETPEQLQLAIPHLEKGVTVFPQGPQARLVLAQSLIRLGRGEQALGHIDSLAQDRPNDPRLLIMAGQALRLSGKTAEAIEKFKRAQAIPEARQRATLELVEALASSGDYKQAAAILGEMIGEDRSNLPAISRWATLLARSGDRTQASKVLDQILEQNPTFREALFLKAAIEANEGQVDSAERLWRRLLAAYPGDPDATIALARMLTDTRRLPEARTLLEGLWKTIDEAKLANNSAGLEVAQERATVELIDRKPEAARPWLERLRGQPLERRSVALWVEFFRLRNAFDEGLAWLRSAQMVEGADVERLRLSSELEMSLGAGEETTASTLTEKLLAGNKEDVEAALAALQRRKRYKEVVTHSRAAIARLGEEPELQFTLAAALERSDSWDEAVIEFRKLLAKDKEHAAGLNYLGYMFAERAVHLDEAKEMLTKAVSLNPTSGAYLDSLGWLYFQTGDLDRAEKHLTEAARLEPFDPTVQEHLGDLYKRRGNGLQAATAYRLALQQEMEETGQKERIEKKLAEVSGATTP